MNLPTTAHAETINTSLPGYGQVTANGPVGIIVGAYYTALMVAGFLALGVLVYAGLMRIFQAGSHSGQSEAKKWFAAAGSGLVLLLGAYFLLTLINPGLTELRMPGLARLAVPVLPAPFTGKPTGYGCVGADGNGAAKTFCSLKNDCTDLIGAPHSFCPTGSKCQIMNYCKAQMPPPGPDPVGRVYGCTETQWRTEGADLVPVVINNFCNLKSDCSDAPDNLLAGPRGCDAGSCKLATCKPGPVCGPTKGSCAVGTCISDPGNPGGWYCSSSGGH